MNRNCRCGGKMVSVRDDKFAFTFECPTCKTRVTQRKRQPGVGGVQGIDSDKKKVIKKMLDRFEAACREDEMKGCGDPEDYASIEREWEKSKQALYDYFHIMEEVNYPNPSPSFSEDE